MKADVTAPLPDFSFKDDPDAIKAREKLASRMTQGEILEAQRMARNWKPQPQRSRPDGYGPYRLN